MSVVKKVINSTSSTPKRRLSGEARHKTILDAALIVFADKGYDLASMDDIAKQTGVSRPVLYDYFPSKETLFFAMLSNQCDLMSASALAISSEYSTTKDRFHSVLRHFFTFIQNHPLVWQVLFMEKSGDRRIAKRHYELQSKANQEIMAFLNPNPKNQTTQDMQAELWGWAVKGVANWWLQEHPEISLDEIVETTENIVWSGFGSTSST